MWKVTWLYWSLPCKKWLDTDYTTSYQNEARDLVWFLGKTGRILVSIESDERNYHVPISIETLRNVLPPVVDLQETVSGTPAAQREDSD
jgi:hypothetical protein